MISLPDVALLALGGMLLLSTIVLCAQMQRPISNAIKWWVLTILFFAALALSGCASTHVREASPLINAHIESIRSPLLPTPSRQFQKAQTDNVILTRAEWLIVRQGQLRRQAIIKALRLEVDAYKKANAIQVQRERQKREQSQEKCKRAIAAEQRRVILPWVFVGTASVVAIVGFSLYIGKIGKTAP